MIEKTTELLITYKHLKFILLYLIITGYGKIHCYEFKTTHCNDDLQFPQTEVITIFNW